MDSSKGFMGHSAEEIQRILQSTQAKELLRRLNENNAQAIRAAADAARRGDYSSAKTLLGPMMQDEKTAKLVEELSRKQGE